jgi:hypothetical protein
MVIYGGRGCGKSAHRIMLASSCRPNVASPFLVTQYTNFSDLAEEFHRSPAIVDTRYIVARLLGEGVRNLLEAINKDEGLQQACTPERLPKLKWFCLHYASEEVSAESILARIRQGSKGALDLPWERFYKAWQTGRVSKLVAAYRRAEVTPRIRFWVTLADTSPGSSPTTSMSPASLLRRFVQLLQSLGIQTLIILLDGIDEPSLLAQNPAAGAELIKPLLLELPLLECPGVEFKCFLPPELREVLAQTPGIRFDRLLVREIIWDTPQMATLLSTRLIAFGDGTVVAIEGLCSEPLRNHIQADIIRHANGVPRNLLRLGDALLMAHARRGTDSLLQVEDWKEALGEFYSVPTTGRLQAPLQPPLWLDERAKSVRIGRKNIPLTDALYDLFLYLYQRPGQTIPNTVLESGTKLSYENIRRIVSRLRKLLEPDPDNPVYLVTVPGEGLRLDNVAPEVKQGKSIRG